MRPTLRRSVQGPRRRRIRLGASPVPGERYVPAPTRDLLLAMRRTMVLMVASLLAMVALVVAGIYGTDIPLTTGPFFALIAVPGAFWALPDMRRASLGLLLDGMRPAWAARWYETGVTFLALPELLRAPYTPADLLAFDAIADHSVRTFDALDLPFVRWAHVNGFTPEVARTYLDAEVALADATDLHLAHVSAPEWATIRDALRATGARVSSGDRHEPAVLKYLALRAWQRRGPAAGGPTPDDAARQWLLLLCGGRAQSPHGPLPPRFLNQHFCRNFTATLTVPCAQHHASPARVSQSRRSRFAFRSRATAAAPTCSSAPCDVTFAGSSVGEWDEALGTLAPWAIKAGMDLDEARAARMDAPERMTVETLTLIHALHAD